MSRTGTTGVGFTYDATNVESFSYDATGNRLSRGSQAYTYASDSHRLTSVGSTPRSYDGNGM